MDFQQLIFAAQVRALAHEFRTSDRQVHLASQPKGYDARAEIDAFDSRNPFEEYIAAAYRDLVNVALKISAIAENDSSAKLAAAMERFPPGKPPTEIDHL